MKEYLIHSIRFTVAFILVLTLQACGGSSNKNAENFTISASTSEITFSNEFLQVSDDTFQVDVNFNGNGLLLGFAPDSQAVGWLSYSTKNVTANTATIEIKVTNAENIVPDIYRTKLRLSTGNVNDVNLVHHDIDISLLVWQLTTDKELISFKSTLGAQEMLLQSINVTSTSNNSWTATTDESWLTVNNAKGTGSGLITLTADPTGFNEAQLLQANLILTETTTGDSKIIPVELGIDQQYLYTNQSVVGFSRTKNINVTAKTLQIASNTNDAVKLSASTSDAWLDVSISDDNSSHLTISKSSDITLTDGLHMATVSVYALDNNNTIDTNIAHETIQVAYYQSSEETSNQVLSEKNIAVNATAVSPYLPHFYVVENNQIATYHIYTGELVATLPIADENATVDQLLVHPEGAYLYARATSTLTAEDGTTSDIVSRYKIDLLNQTADELTEADIEYEPLQFISINGRHFVISQTLEIADDNFKRVYWDESNAFFTSQIDQALNAQSIYALDLNDFSFKRYRAEVNDFTTQAVSLEQTHSYIPTSLEAGQVITSFVADDDDRGLYLTSPNSEWISFDGAIFTDQGLLTQSENALTLNLVKANNGRAHFLRAAQDTGYYLDIYNESQALINSVSTNGQQPSSLHLSADDKKLIINAVNAQQIELINIEQLQSSAQNVTFNTVNGAETPSAQVISVTGLSDDWQVTTSAPWLTVNSDYVVGELNLTLSILDNQLTVPGAYHTQIVIHDNANGTSTTISVTANIDSVRFSSNYPALAFNDMSNIDTLSHTVNILNNLNDASLNWSASTSASWLTLVEDLGQDTLAITADSTALADGIHTATINITPDISNNGQQGSQISVTLHKSAEQSAELVINDININYSNNRFNAVLDPIRPYLYIASGHSIVAINIYNGSIVDTVSSPLADIELTNLVVHPDGSMLLASNLETYQDSAGDEQTRINHYKVDLNNFTLSEIPANTVTINNNYRPAAIVLISGQAVVVTQAQEFADLNLTSLFWQPESAFVSNQFYDIKNTGSVLSFNSLDNTIYQYNLAYNSVADLPLTLGSTTSYTNASFNNSVRSLAASDNGDTLYSASVLSEWSTFDGNSYVDQGVLYNTPMLLSLLTATDSSGNVYFYRLDSTSGYTLAKFNNVQQSLWSVIHTSGSLDTLISPDYQRLISYNSTNKTLSFDTLPD